MTEIINKIYKQDIGHSVLKCEVNDYKKDNPEFSIEDSLNGNVKIVNLRKSDIVKLLSFLTQIIENHDAATEN